MSAEILKPQRLAVLFLLITFATVLGLFFTPALPQIARDFGISETKAQWAMSFFLVGYCLGQLPYGPIANRFGRKKALLGGVSLALVGTVLAYLAADFSLLCFARLIQALGAAVGLKISFTMIGDSLTGTSATRAVSLLTMAFGVMPGLATAAGGFVVESAGWRECFLFLALYAVFVGLYSFSLPETAKKLDSQALEGKRIFHGLRNQFKDSYTVLHAILTGLATAVIYIFATIAPYIGINQLGLTPFEFGLWSIVPSVGFIAGAVVTRNLSGRYNPRINMLSGILLVFLGTALLGMVYANDALSTWTLFPLMFLIQLGTNVIWSTASSKGLSESTDKSNASAVIQFINVGLAVIGTFLVELVSPTAPFLLPGAFAIILVLMLATWLKLKEHHAKR